MRDESKKSHFRWIVGLGCVLIVLYPLSFGAADCIYLHSGPTVQRTLATLYEPINWLCGR